MLRSSKFTLKNYYYFIYYVVSVIFRQILMVTKNIMYSHGYVPDEGEIYSFKNKYDAF